MKTSLFIFFAILVVSGSAAQTISHDSLMVEIANTDVKTFKLNGNKLKQFRVHHFSPSSDYFKPTPVNTSDTSLLKDSTYIKAFKQAAYNKTLHRRTTGHYVLIIGSIAIGVTLIIAAITGSALSNSFKQ